MTLQRANKILKDNGIRWASYFDLVGINTDNDKIKQAIERVKTFLTIGR